MIPLSAHADTFARDRLPPPDQWPDFLLEEAGLRYPERLNCGAALIDATAAADPQRPAIRYRGAVWTYGGLAAAANRIAHALVEDFGVQPGGRVLLHARNRPELFASWLAVMKAGAIAVTTMPLLRRKELQQIVEKAEVAIALCETDLCGELEPLVGASPLRRLVAFGAPDAALERISAGKPATFAAVDTRQDDICMIAFTSGTTGEPKAAAHFHRDVMAICDTFAAHMLSAGPDSVFTGASPIGFTFGLGALVAFPLYFGGSVALPDDNTPAALAGTIAAEGVTHLFAAPTGYRALLGDMGAHDLSSLKVCVSAGEPLPQPVSDAWFAATGVRITDGLGSTEMMHIFISAAGDDIRPGALGRPAPGYEARLLDEDGHPLAGAATGRLAVRGPTGCLYLADPRQTDYVVNGWNLTGDICRRDEDGYYWYVARADDLIVSSGYKIAGPEIEAALLLHPAVAECAVIGWPDGRRGQIVKAVVVLKAETPPSEDLVRALQDHVKQLLAPYKYPRTIEFRETLPKTSTGKLNRRALKPPV